MIKPILHYPDPRLRVPGEVVTEFSDELRVLVEDMAETMYAAPGVGLAATQIGVAQRVFIIDISMDDEESALRVFVNPEIVESSGKVCWEEGCLSFPGVHEEVERAAQVRVKACTETGEPFELEATDLLAVAIQHELDHLDGKLMIDRLGMLKKRYVHRSMAKRVASASARA